MSNFKVTGDIEGGARINVKTFYDLNGKHIMRTLTNLGSYSAKDNTTVTLRSPIDDYSLLFFVFKGVSSRNIGCICSAEKDSRFSIYYPNVGGLRGYVMSNTTIRVEDVDGATNFEIYGVK